MSNDKEVLVPKYEDFENKTEEEKKILNMIDEGGPIFTEKIDVKKEK